MLKRLFTNIRTPNITEFGDLIYAGAKLASDKISIPLKNPNRNRKIDGKLG